MAPRVDLHVVVQNIVAKNPNMSQENLQVQLRNKLQELKKNGAKISDKEIIKARGMLVEEINTQNLKANFQPQVSADAQANIDKLNTAKAKTAYTAPKVEVREQPAKSYTRKVNKKSQALVQEMIDKKNSNPANFEEYLDTLSEEGRAKAIAESNKVKVEPYVSVKKAKSNKRFLEHKSKAEHRAYRNTKDLRNKVYCTKNGIMTKDAKRIYNAAQEALNGKADYREVIDNMTRTSGKSAEESARVFIENGFKPIEKAASNSSKLMKFGKWGIAAAVVLGLFGIFDKKKAPEVVAEPNLQNLQVKTPQIPYNAIA